LHAQSSSTGASAMLRASTTMGEERTDSIGMNEHAGSPGDLITRRRSRHHAEQSARAPSVMSPVIECCAAAISGGRKHERHARRLGRGQVAVRRRRCKS
jgi:hypothetical protein